MAIKIIYFVHGTTTDNEQDLATGWLPGELSKEGKEQAKELGSIVSGEHFDVVFCSDLKRAVDSARIAFGNKYKIIQDNRLRECNYGDFNGRPAKNFKDNMNKYINNSFPNGESYREVEERVSSFLNSLKKNYNDNKVAVIAHQGPQLALDVLIKRKSWVQAIEEDWRKIKAWQPGWLYVLK